MGIGAVAVAAIGAADPDADGYGCTTVGMPIGIPIGIPIDMGAPNVGMGAPNVGMGAPIGMPNVGCCCTQIESGFAKRLQHGIAVFVTEHGIAVFVTVFVKVQEMRDAGDADRQHWQLCMAA